MSVKMYSDEMRFFWTRRWWYGKTVDFWANLVYACNTNQILILKPRSTRFTSTMSAGQDHVRRGKKILLLGLQKIFTEKQLTEEEYVSYKNMLENGKDKDTIFLAVTVMQMKKPKKFKKENEDF